MNLFLMFLFLAFSNLAYAAETLPSFTYELSCMRLNQGNEATIMIHAVIVFDGDTNTCTVTKGNYYKGASEAYEINFKCEKPIPLALDKNHPMQAWVLRGEDEHLDRISKLVLVMDHATELANGFATAPNGISYSLACKKW